MKIKKSTRYIFAAILIMIMAAIISSLVLRYHVKPGEVFYADKENLMDDGSFESFNQAPGDCCNGNFGNASIFASKSTEAFDGLYSLNLTSSNHCACINKPLNDFFNDKKYILSFYYKGDKPHICNWVSEDNNCLPNKILDSSKSWAHFNQVLSFTNKSTSAAIYFYADSNGRETITNLYDDLQVHQLVQMDPSYSFKDDEQYIIKTDLSNIVHNGEPLNDNEGYYLVTGKPDITLKFPLTELVLLLFMMLVVIRLLFKKPTQNESSVRDVKRV